MEKDEAAARAAQKQQVTGQAAEQVAQLKQAREARSPAVVPAADRVPAKPKPEPKPIDLARDDYWAEFETAEVDQQIDLLYSAITQPALPNLLDSELIFESFSAIFYATTNSDGRDRFDALVDVLRQTQPTQYLEEAHILLDWQITNALATQRDEAVLRLTGDYAQIAGAEHTDELFNLVNKLAYHGQTQALRQLVDTTLPLLRQSTNAMPGAADKLAAFAIDGLIFDRLDHMQSVTLDEEGLLDQFIAYMPEIDQEKLPNYIRCVSGQDDRAWTLADFDPSSNDFVNNTRHLTLAFTHYLRTISGVAYFKAELARGGVFQYLWRRAKADLGARRGRTSGKRQIRNLEHVLCPDYATLDRFLGDLLNFFNVQHYEAAAMFEVLPAWLDFLEHYQLIDLQQRIAAIEDYKRLRPAVLRLFENNKSDPTMYQHLAAWRE